jgi:hypothetical protein
MHVVHDNADAVLRHLHPFAVLQGALGVLEALCGDALAWDGCG